MELLNHHECILDTDTSHANNELAIFDLLGEFLSVSLEKQDVEVIIESNDFFIDRAGSIKINDATRVEIDFEDIIETDEKLVVTVSGSIADTLKQTATFTLFFQLAWDNSVDATWKRGNRTGLGTNALLLQFGRKCGQLSDAVFKVKLYREELNGRQHELGEGKGFLLFGREQSTKVN